LFSHRLDFTNLYWALVAREIDVQLLNVGNYISLNNEITIEDIAEGLQRAVSLTNLNDAQEFYAIVHSTGMLVVRAWLAHQNIAPGENQRLKQLKQLIGVAPATWGSPQAHKGRSWLGALVKGSKTPGPDFMNAGNLVLEGLELGSRYTWDLAHADLLGSKPTSVRGRIRCMSRCSSATHRIRGSPASPTIRAQTGRYDGQDAA
jgi:hypothetical protein